jgi:putative flippase GtrA
MSAQAWFRAGQESAHGKQQEKRNPRVAAWSARSTVVRWMKFNFVGAIGIAVQFAVLFLLKSKLHFHYLVATGIAVEAALIHNFVWHERFTWADRVLPGEARVNRRRLAGWRLIWRAWLGRVLRFHLANGAVSMMGNIVVMGVMVGAEHMNYLVANGLAIALCSIANFLLSDGWVFE